jgi:hypothetical protein
MFFLVKQCVYRAVTSKSRALLLMAPSNIPTWYSVLTIYQWLLTASVVWLTLRLTGDRVLVVGSSSEPWLVPKKDEKLFTSFWSKALFTPTPDYAARRVCM